MSRSDVEFLSKDKKNHKIADQLVEILQALIRIPSPSGYEEEIAGYLVNWGKNYPEWKVHSDEISNVFFVPKGCEDQELPFLMAHSDTAQNSDSAYLARVNIVNKYSADGTICEYPDIQLGYDDKCGIAIILWLIANRPDLKFRAIITVQEEGCHHNPLPNKPKGTTISDRSGGCGIQYALEHTPDFFNSQWGLLLDRAEDKETVENSKPEIKFCKIREPESDIIWKYSGRDLCEKDFLKKLVEISKDLKTPMRPGESMAKADAMNIKLFSKTQHISLVNLATGVYREHDRDDYVNIFQVIRTLKVAEKCIRMNKELSEAARAGEKYTVKGSSRKVCCG